MEGEKDGVQKECNLSTASNVLYTGEKIDQRRHNAKEVFEVKKLLGLVLAAMLLLSTVPATIAEETGQTVTQTETHSAGQKGTIVNCKTAANVREKATQNSKLLGTAKRGETYKVVATAGNWVRIQYSKSVEGYVYKTYIRITDEGTEPTPTGRTATIVNCKVAANVRAKATQNSKLLGTVKKGETYDVLGTSGNWVKIDYDGTAGYVFSRYVKLTGEDEPIEGKTGTIRCNTHVNIRAKATKYSTLLGTAKNGETFTVKGRSGNWIRIDFKGKTGYVYKTYIRIG